MVLFDASSLRGCKKYIQRIFNAVWPSTLGKVKIPSVTSVGRWIKRVGLYKLIQPIEKTKQIIIMDASITVGSKKLLLLLRISVDKFKELVAKKQPLRFQDLDPVCAEFHDTINGDIVLEALKKAEEKGGIINQVCKDGGSDLTAGTKKFQEHRINQSRREFNAEVGDNDMGLKNSIEKFDEVSLAIFAEYKILINQKTEELGSKSKFFDDKDSTAISSLESSGLEVELTKKQSDKVDLNVNSSCWSTYDIPHKCACILKSLLENDPIWIDLMKKMDDCRKKEILGPYSYLIPPQQRSKSRFMNLDERLRWASRMLLILDGVDGAKIVFKDGEIEKRYGWLKEFSLKIPMYCEYGAVSKHVRHKVRTEGLHLKSHKQLSDELEFLSSSDKIDEYVGALIDFMEFQTHKLSPENILCASSEIVESGFGKLKTLIGEDKKHGYTTYALSIAACFGPELDKSLIKDALQTVTDKDVQKWGEEHLGKTHLQKRRACLGLKKTNSMVKFPEEKKPESSGIFTEKYG